MSLVVGGIPLTKTPVRDPFSLSFSLSLFLYYDFFSTHRDVRIYVSHLAINTSENCGQKY